MRQPTVFPTLPAFAALTLALALTACARRPNTSENATSPTVNQAAETAAETTANDTTPDLRCSICFAHNYQRRGAHGYGTDASAQTLDTLRSIGTRAVSLTPFLFMATTTGTTFRRADTLPGGERADRVRAEAAQAQQRGMMVMIKPHIWIGNGWRGNIDPDPAQGGWDAWFAGYREMILEWAVLAQDVEAEWFVIGVELVSSTAQHDAEWRALIADIRAVYDGQITYAANWDEAENVTFWDALDAVGVQMFAPLVEPGEAATPTSLREGANAWLQHYIALLQPGQPLILTEVGYLNRPNAAVRPYEWPDSRTEAATTAGDQAQAEAYRAVLDTFGTHDRVDAIYWWKVFTDPNSTEEGPVGFSPIGKPAEAVLREACAP